VCLHQVFEPLTARFLPMLSSTIRPGKLGRSVLRPYASGFTLAIYARIESIFSACCFRAMEKSKCRCND